jgi:NAD(P)-dependent dehydrogenase (short-subunit alcohol dehydrogenase family)
MLLKGKVAVVAGVGPGLGREIALALAREGAAVALAARTQSFLESVATDIRAIGGDALPVATNVTDRAQCDALVDAALGAFGQVDCLVNSAFRPDVFVPFADADLAQWRKIFEVNLWGALGLTQAVLPHMRGRRSGSIVFVSSMVVRKPMALQGGYAASKGALLLAAQVLAKELGADGIRVNSVVPGWMKGPNFDVYLDIMSAANGTTRDEEEAKVAAGIPLGVVPPDEDCANAVVFLASDLSAMVTGQAIDVNGGEVVH